MDPNIVDPVNVREYPRRVPMAQVFDIHLIQATPLRSIAEPTYFWEELQRCEAAKREQIGRRRKVGRMLYDVASMRRVILLLQGDVEPDVEMVDGRRRSSSLCS